MERKKIGTTDIIYNSTIAICLSASFFSQISGIKELRYISYSGLFIGLMLCYVYGFKKWRIIPAYIKCYLVLILYGSVCCLNINMNFSSIYYVVFWLSAVLIFISGITFNARITIVNIVFMLSQLAIIKEVHLDFSLLAFLKSSTSTAEINAPAFIFPSFFIYHLYKGNKWMALLNLFVSIIFFKRIVFIAIMVVIGIYCYQRYISKKSFKRINPIFFISINIIYILTTISFANGTFNDFLYHTFGISVGELSMGRNTLYRILTKEFANSDILSLLFGHGAASTYSIMNMRTADDLHNDVLKITFDNGIILFVIFFYYLYKEANNWPKLSLAVMMNIFFLTDNTLIYTIVIMAFFFVNQEFEQNNIPDETEHCIPN